VRPPTFYWESCCDPGRRAFLRATLAATAGLVVGAARAARAGGVQDSASIIRAYATRLDDPWAMVHGVRAMGADFAGQSGDRALTYVLSTFLDERTVNGLRYLAFPEAVERHPNMFLKTFLEAGAPPDTPFPFRGRRRTLSEVIEGARALFRFSDATDRNTIAWSLIALARSTPRDRGGWTNAWRERIDLGRVAAAGLDALEEASRPMEAARARGVVPEQQAPIHHFTCGGTHLLYSLLVAAHTGHLPASERKRVQRQMDLLVYRLAADVQMIDRFYTPQLDKVAGTGFYLLDARIKFVGHAFECLGLSKRHGLYAVPAREAARVREAGGGLDADIHQLAGLDLEPVRTNIHDLYQQLVGDVCHARHGLVLA
jgi:hypothetical protein